MSYIDKADFIRIVLFGRGEENEGQRKKQKGLDEGLVQKYELFWKI